MRLACESPSRGKRTAPTPGGPVRLRVDCRYNPKELTRGGKGGATNSSAGLTWSGFRTSDDPGVYGYLVPANMFAVVVLGYFAELAQTVWGDNLLAERAGRLRGEINDGI